jgi:hypothetical protein
MLNICLLKGCRGHHLIIGFNRRIEFANFLKTNAITPYNDSFEEYLKHLIKKEKSLSKHGSKNEEAINGLHQMLASYEKEKAILEN